MTETPTFHTEEPNYGEFATIETFLQGTVYDARKGQDALWNRQKANNRAHNISLAQGRVNGKYLSHGNKRA